jgi:hypothetical protein
LAWGYRAPPNRSNVKRQNIGTDICERTFLLRSRPSVLEADHALEAKGDPLLAQGQAGSVSLTAFALRASMFGFSSVTGRRSIGRRDID